MSAPQRDRPANSAGWIIAATIGLLGFVVLTALMLAHVALWFDPPLLQAAEGIRGDGSLWRAISDSANIPLIVIGVGLVLVLLVRRRFRHAILVAVVLLAVTAGSEGVIAIEIARRRIPQAVAVLLFALVAADAMVVGVARVALAAHYPSDALGGILAGVGVLGLYGWLTRRLGLAPGADHRANARG